MAALAPLSLPDRIRQRVDALPLDRAPLRRAGLLTLLLIGLLVLGKVFSPTPKAASDRQDVRPATEEVSAPPSSSVWTGGRVLAILFLATGGGIAFWLHRRAGGRTVSSGSTLKILETHTLGPSQSLRLVACGEEVLLLSVATEGTTLLRHWPRETFGAEPVSFATTLASLTTEEEPVASSLSPEANSAPPRTSPLPWGEDREAMALSQPQAGVSQQGEGLTASAYWLDASNERATPSSASARADESAAPPLSTDDSASRPYAPTAAFASSTDAASETHRMAPGQHGEGSVKEAVVDELATSEPAPSIARGTLFPARTNAPRQFNVDHG